MRDKSGTALNDWPLERTCPVCGKIFCFQSLSIWGYKLGEDLVCSYSCLKKLENKRKRATMTGSAQMVQDGLNRGLSIAEIARETGLSVYSVYYHRRQMEKKK